METHSDLHHAVNEPSTEMGSQRDDRILSWSLLAKTLARRAGRLIVSLRYPVSSTSPEFDIERKTNATDLVTSADLASQRLIFEGLKEKCPSHRLIGEEDSDHYGSLDDRPTWIVDAIDGTTNFVHGINNFAVSIALSIDKSIVIGVVYNPCTDEMFSAIRGHGAFLNDVAIHHSNCSQLEEAIIISEWGYDRSVEGVRKMLSINERLLVRKVRGIRQLGSGTLNICFVAMGRADAVYCGVANGDAWKIWDYAASSLIAQEAGAIMRTVQGAQFDIEADSMVCATPQVMDQLLSVINES